MKILSGIKLSLIGTILIVGLNGCKTFPTEVKPIKRVKADKSIEFGIDKVTGEKIRDLNLIDFSNKIRRLTNLDKGLYSGSCPFKKIRGLSVEKVRDGYAIKYLNGEYYCKTGTKYITNLDYFFKTKYNGSKISFEYPKSYKYTVSTNAVGIKIAPLATPSELEIDIQNIYNHLDRITINKDYNFKGDIDAQYPDKSIYANFKRLLGNYDYGSNERVSEIKKRNTFSLKFKDKSYPLYVEVVPYRNSSKVTYSTKLYYSIGANEKCSLSKSDIEQLHRRVKAIVNN